MKKDITTEDVERIRQFFTVPDEMDEIVQPLIPEPIHTTPPNDDYVEPATKSILDELLEKFGDEILNVTMVDEEANFNPTKDLEELERLLTKEPQSNFTKIQIGTLYLLEGSHCEMQENDKKQGKMTKSENIHGFLEVVTVQQIWKVGNVYVQFTEEEYAAKALKKLTRRYYADPSKGLRVDDGLFVLIMEYGNRIDEDGFVVVVVEFKVLVVHVTEVREMNIRFAPIRWCRIAEAPHCSHRGSQWCFDIPHGLVGNNILRLDKGSKPPPHCRKHLGFTIKECYNCEEKGHYAIDCLKFKVRDSKYFKEQMLIAIKDEGGIHLDEEENYFMLMSATRDDQLEELNASVIMMVRLQPTDNDSKAEPTYDSDFVSEVNDSQIKLINGLFVNNAHEQQKHAKLETIKPISVDDKLDSNIMFDDLYVEFNGEQVKHVHDVHDQKFDDFKSLIYNVQIEAENQCMYNNYPSDDVALCHILVYEHEEARG
ncbi:retrovirus-related pol polyprotein from transposon TNT 1-94 [Tanacetum coccineum]